MSFRVPENLLRTGQQPPRRSTGGNTARSQPRRRMETHTVVDDDDEDVAPVVRMTRQAARSSRQGEEAEAAFQDVPVHFGSKFNIFLKFK